MKENATVRTRRERLRFLFCEQVKDRGIKLPTYPHPLEERTGCEGKPRQESHVR